LLTDGLARGTRHRLTVPCGGDLAFPVLIARGAQPGRTLVTTAAVHGDEYEGTRAILDTFAELDPATFAGDWVAVPAANPPAFWNGTRTSPLDGGNLARVFPGDNAADAPATQRLAWRLGESIVSLADFYLDLHSGGVGWSMPTMAGYDAADARSEAGARIFGAETIWGHPEVPPGRTVSFAKSRGIPFLYTEARGGGRLHLGDVAVMKRGIRNLLRHLGILASPFETAPLVRHLFGEGNIHHGINAPSAGFFFSDVQLLDAVGAGQPLGQLVTLHGETIATFTAPRDGVVGLLREFPMVHEGDPLFLIAELRES